jgi:predicted Zn-dependent protease
MKLSGIVVLLAVAAGAVACQSAPVTGRKQFMVVPESQAIEASKQAYAQTLAPLQKQGKINDDPALKARVDRITARLVAQAIVYRPETESWDWQVAVIDDPKTVNAWCMAGGRMAIYTGIIQQLQLTDDEIAQVMGHEIAHALAKHTAERMSVAVAQQAGLSVAAALLGSDVKSQAALQAAAIATTVGVQLPNCRTQEAEADRIGIELAAKAGYDPSCRAEALGKNARRHQQQRPIRLAQHPSRWREEAGIARRAHPAGDALLRRQVSASGVQVQDRRRALTTRRTYIATCG